MPKVKSSNPQIQQAIDERRARAAKRSKKPAAKKAAPSRTKGILNIIKKRAGQAMRVANKQASGK